MKKKLKLSIWMGVILFASIVSISQSKTLQQNSVGLNSIIMIAQAQGEEGDLYSTCWSCPNPYGQNTYFISCGGFGFPGCVSIPCGYNYCW